MEVSLYQSISRSWRKPVHNSEQRITSPLLQLPTELILKILSHLDVVCALCLSLTCRALYSIVTPETWKNFRKHRERIDWCRLLHMLQRDQSHQYWMCVTCERLHPLQKFPHTRFKGPRFQFNTEFLEHFPHHLDHGHTPPLFNCGPGPISSRTGTMTYKATPHGLFTSFTRTY